MESVLRYILRWPSVERLIIAYAWFWPLLEVMHFVGIVLLVGIVGMFDLRLMGFAKEIPIASLRRLLPWAVFGSVLTFTSGLLFVTGVYANVEIHAYIILMNNTYLQLKLLFLGILGLNLAAFYVTGVSREVDELGVGQDTPTMAKVIGGVSLFFWLATVYVGRLIVWGKFTEGLTP
ncbi:MAG TPA: hypothetical protein VJL59_02335 [Anaerolineales bacterium]|nr:hypothetical protein [Anaerolineales bacterium]